MRVTRHFAAILGLALGLLSPAAGRAQDAAPDRVAVTYGPAAGPAHERLRERLRQAGALELSRRILSPLRLPRPLHLETRSCDGDTDAWFEGDRITICYEYLAWIAEVARRARPGSPAEQEAAMVGPFLDVILHEAGHAVFDYLDIPILGREEDAADQMAALWLLTLAREKADGLIAGIVAVYLDDAGVRSLADLQKRRLRLRPLQAQADPHSTPVQRLYNLICLAYGSDPQRFDPYRRDGVLPADRAEGCEDEYRQVRKAYARLIAPHVDPETAARVYGAR